MRRCAAHRDGSPVLSANCCRVAGVSGGCRASAVARLRRIAATCLDVLQLPSSPAAHLVTGFHGVGTRVSCSPSATCRFHPPFSWKRLSYLLRLYVDRVECVQTPQCLSSITSTLLYHYLSKCTFIQLLKLLHMTWIEPLPSFINPSMITDPYNHARLKTFPSLQVVSARKPSPAR